jgi:putative NADH-flavin reductase
MKLTNPRRERPHRHRTRAPSQRCRPPGNRGPPHIQHRRPFVASLRVVRVAAVTDAEALVPALFGSEIVLSALGARTPTDAGLVAPMTRCLLRAMGQGGVGRILTVSAASVGTPQPADPLVARKVMWPVMARFLRPVVDDLREMEDHLAASPPDWTSVRPPRLVNRGASGKYRTTIGGNVPRGLVISRADVAHAMLTVAADRRSFGQMVGVAW